MSTNMSEASSTTLRMAVEAAKAATAAAAHAAALILLEANGGHGIFHPMWKGERPDMLCAFSSGATFAGHIHAESYGDRAAITVREVTPAAYERMRAWAQGQNSCHHDEDCDCLDEPWPTLAALSESDQEHDIDYRAATEHPRGSVSLAFGRITVRLHDEPVVLADSLIRVARLDA